MRLKNLLKKLPLQKRLQAMENIRRRTTDMIKFNDVLNITNQKDLKGSFVFAKTKQGHSYWMEIDAKYFGH